MRESSSSLRILVIDDESNIRRTLRICLEGQGHTVAVGGNVAEATRLVGEAVFDVAFLDIRLEGSSGLDLLPLFATQAPWTKVVVITAYASIDSAVDAMRRGAFDYLPKPFTPDQVKLAVARAVRQLALEQQVRQLKEAGGSAIDAVDLDSRNPAMRRLLETARRVAASDATILLRGPSGTGKSVLARAIHGWSGRSGTSFVTVSCPSLEPALVESELFGHVRGAFTGAVHDQPGRLAAAEGGTLFLDEIGDLPPSVQPKLLRLMQERVYERLGDPTPRPANVRIVVATHVDLEAAVSAGRFREDLYFRLNVIPLTLPGLAERPEDILPLAERLLAHLTAANHRPLGGFSAAARLALEAHGWPGNLRELRNLIERAVILAPGPAVESSDLFPATVAAAAGSAIAGRPLTLAGLEEQHIRRVLATASSYQEAADMLGIDQATLWRRRKQYGLLDR